MLIEQIMMIVIKKVIVKEEVKVKENNKNK